MDERADVILHKFRLDSAEPARGEAKRLREQQARGYQRRNRKDGADAFPDAAGSHRRHQAVHE